MFSVKQAFGNNAAKPAVEHAGRNTGFSGVGNVEREVKYFGDILASNAAGKNERCPWGGEA